MYDTVHFLKICVRTIDKIWIIAYKQNFLRIPLNTARAANKKDCSYRQSRFVVIKGNI